MRNTPGSRQSQTALDLFERWLDHRQQDAPAQETDGKVPAGSPAPAPATTSTSAMAATPTEHDSQPAPYSDGRAVLQALTEQMIRPRSAPDDDIENAPADRPQA